MRLPLLAMLLLWPIGAAARTSEMLVADYCVAVQKSDEAAAVAMMAPALQEAVAAARRANDQFAANHPDEKPPLGDGLRLSAFPDVPESCMPEAIDESSVTIEYRPLGSAEGAWRDRLILVPDGAGGVQIGDIEFGLSDADTLSLWLSQAAEAE